MYIIRIALDDGGGKWPGGAGTVLGAYPANYKFNGGDMGSFYLFRINQTGSLKLEDFQAMRFYKKINLDSLMDAAKKNQLLAQKAQVDANNRAKRNTKEEDIAHKPDLVKSIKYSDLVFEDTGYEPPVLVQP